MAIVNSAPNNDKNNNELGSASSDGSVKQDEVLLSPPHLNTDEASDDNAVKGYLSRVGDKLLVRVPNEILHNDQQINISNLKNNVIDETLAQNASVHLPGDISKYEVVKIFQKNELYSIVQEERAKNVIVKEVGESGYQRILELLTSDETDVNIIFMYYANGDNAITKTENLYQLNFIGNDISKAHIVLANPDNYQSTENYFFTDLIKDFSEVGGTPQDFSISIEVSPIFANFFAPTYSRIDKVYDYFNPFEVSLNSQSTAKFTTKLSLFDTFDEAAIPPLFDPNKPPTDPEQPPTDPEIPPSDPDKPPIFNIGPIAFNDFYFTFFGSDEVIIESNIGVLLNDFDPEDDRIYVTAINGVELSFDGDGNVLPIDLDDGTLIIDPDGGFYYQDFGDLILAPVEFEYTIEDVFGARDSAWVFIDIFFPPVAIDDYAITVIDSPIMINLSDNDIDIDGDIDVNSIIIIDSDDGTVEVLDDDTGDVIFTPDINFIGSTSFEYAIADEFGEYSNFATVFIDVFPNGFPVYQSLEERGDLMLQPIATQAITSHDSWEFFDPNHKILSYAFFDRDDIADGYEIFGLDLEFEDPGFIVGSFTEYMKEAYRQAFQMIEDLTELEFVEVTITDPRDAQLFFDNNINISLFAKNIGGHVLGAAFEPTGIPGFGFNMPGFDSRFWQTVSGDIELDILDRPPEDFAPGGIMFTTILHELGHSLGLVHPQNYADTKNFYSYFEMTPQILVDSYAEFDFSHRNMGIPTNEFLRGNNSDNERNTVMSYVEYQDLPQTYQVIDISALQYIYGANYATNIGNDIYIFDDSIGLATDIWDAGGIDTFDGSTSIKDLMIDLTPGALSFVIDTNETFNIASTQYGIAMGTKIENAFGGFGDDILVGNAEINILDGGTGNNTLSYYRSYESVLIDLSTLFVDGGHGIGDIISNFSNIRGSNFNDVILGDNQDNIIEGGAGIDVLDGAAGSNTVSYENAFTSVIVDLANSTSSEGDFLFNFNHILGSRYDDTLIGNAEDNNINGGDGDDILIGGLGIDILDGGTGLDIVDYGSNLDAIFVDLLNGINSEGDIYFSIEGIIGSEFDDILIGDDNENFFIGLGGVNLIDGQGGRDVVSYLNANNPVVIDLLLDFNSEDDDLINIEGIIGSRFDDILIGDEKDNIFYGYIGQDFIDGGDGIDTVSYRYSGFVAVNLLTNIHSAGNAIGDVLINIENIEGSNFSDTLIGDNFDNEIYGLDGADILAGLAGADLLDGGDSFQDIADYRDSDDGIDISLQDNLAFGGHANGDVLLNIEGLYGSDFSDRLIGTNGNNFLFGGSGDDFIDGLGGDDIIFSGLGNDEITFGGGYDSLNYIFSNAGVNVNFNTYFFDGGDATGDFYNDSPELIYGSNFADVIIADYKHNTLFGNEGDDLIFGGEGNDLISGGEGYDTLIGGNGSDTLDYQLHNNGIIVDLQNDSVVSNDFAQVDQDFILEFENIIGTRFDDILLGDSESNYVIDYFSVDEINGDTIRLFAGDDMLEYAGKVAIADGGDDFDTIVTKLDNVSIILHNDLDVLNYINFEAIDFRSPTISPGVGNQLTLTVSDVLDLPDNNLINDSLYLIGGVGEQLNLTTEGGSWVEVAPGFTIEKMINGTNHLFVEYAHSSNSDANVFVSMELNNIIDVTPEFTIFQGV